MHPEPKKLGELLLEAQLLTASQLQEALRYQRITGGRMGSNLVTLGFISEDVLMDFLSRQTGVPRMDLRHVVVPPAALERIPRRLADQLNILPVAIKEPKSLVLAMADPSDLNAIDSARFASGLNIEPVVATHSALKMAIAEQYAKLDLLTSKPHETGGIPVPMAFGDALPVSMDVGRIPLDRNPLTQTGAIALPNYGKDPFFDETSPRVGDGPAAFFGGDPPDPFDMLARATPAPVSETPAVIHDRVASSQRAPKLDQYQTRTLILGLVRLLQRRGILNEDELARMIQMLIDSREIKDA